jgi:hypothetical protein
MIPNCVLLDPKFLDEGTGTSADDHPHADIRAGQSFLNQVYEAVTSSPAWGRKMLVINYDEWGWVLRPRRTCGRPGQPSRVGAARFRHTLPGHLAPHPPQLRRPRGLRSHLHAESRGMSGESAAVEPAGQRRAQHRGGAQLPESAEPDRAPLVGADRAGCALRGRFDCRLRARMSSGLLVTWPRQEQLSLP